MATKRKSTKTDAPRRSTTPSLVHRLGKRPDPTKSRSEEWPKEWADLAERYGGPRRFAEEVIGISYQSLWRYALRGDAVPAVVGNFVRVLAATQSLKSPV